MELEVTSKSMLSGVGRNEPSAWERFYGRYKVLVFMRGRRYGFTDTEIDDLLSRVMMKFFQVNPGCVHPIFAYDSSKGRFRDFFCRIVNNVAIDMLRKRQKLSEVSMSVEGNKDIDLPDESGVEDAQREYDLARLHLAFEQIKGELPARQIQAFIAARMDGVSPKKISQLQGTSLATVYNDITAVTEALKNALRVMPED